MATSVTPVEGRVSTTSADTTKGSWLEQMLARKPRTLVTVTLANKMARIVWALLAKAGTYRAPTGVAA